MADKPVCKIDGCDKSAKTRGMCRPHYKEALRQGLPRKYVKGQQLAWLNKAARSDADDCIDWPFFISSGGYGMVRFGGTTRTASRASCEIAHGEPLTGNLEAAHKCGNRKCVNGSHIYWATPKENAMDAQRHGTTPRGERHGRAKLSVHDVIKIRGLLVAGETSAGVAEKFNVSRRQISNIGNRTKWAHIP